MRHPLYFLVGLAGLGLISLTSPLAARAQPLVIEPALQHLRATPHREWSEFPENPAFQQGVWEFDARANTEEATLQIRQQDVKQAWRVTLNDKPVGELVRDENDMVIYLPLAAGLLVDGRNELRIAQAGGPQAAADDVRVGELVLQTQSRSTVLGAARLTVRVLDADTGEPLPARLTILTEDGALQSTDAVSNLEQGVRPGTIYVARGQVSCGLPAGRYTIYAGRGFEYSLASETCELQTGGEHATTLRIRREVPTPGYVACDTHVHTLTHSGHGDATVLERMLTLAGEGIELPIATDHNVFIDHEPFARETQLRAFFTPVVGNEVTTRNGHFNVFPVAAGARLPNHQRETWSEIFDEIFATPGVRIAILNHARDLHSGVRPFGPKLHHASSGASLDGWPQRYNGMEVINSGATQTDLLELLRDWMAVLNHGLEVTPVGSSDSHDVARHFVGQGRTYIRCDDRDPGAISISEAVDSFLAGRVMVSYGLAVELRVNERFRSGDLAALPDEACTVEARVLGPHWVQAKRLLLFLNGEIIRDVDLAPASPPEPGVKWTGQWTLPRPAHDAHLVAVALGPGIEGSYWRTAKPYQPTSPDWTPQVMGCSGAIWLDADRDSRRSSAADYAAEVWQVTQGDAGRLLARLADFDTAVAIQTAHLWVQQHGMWTEASELGRGLPGAAPAVRGGFARYERDWRACQVARQEP